MKYPKLIMGRFLKRYKRFFAEIQLTQTGQMITAHCVNTGSMQGCLKEGAAVAVSMAENPKRKLKYTLEMIKINGVWIGINTILANRLVYEALEENKLVPFEHIIRIQREVSFHTHTRFDFYVETASEKIFIEVKNVTLKQQKTALFPDAVSVRATKHLQELLKAKQQGYRVLLLFVCQRNDVESFAPASMIDPIYAQTLQKAAQQGLEIIALRSKVSVKENKIYCTIPIKLDTF